jgi:glycosyltransferase involved in cell wall biosynthesis
LAREGIEIHIATTDDNDRDRLLVPYGVPVEQDSVTYWYFRRQTHLYTFSWPLSRWLARNTARFDLIHIHALFSYATLPAAFWASRYDVPYIVRPLGTLCEWGITHRRPNLKRLSFRLLERRVLAHAALVHYTSNQEQLEAEKLGITTAAAVIPNALPDDAADAEPFRIAVGQFRATYPEVTGRWMILFLSRLDPKKGLDLLLKAFAAVRARVPAACLVLAGDGQPAYVESLKAQAHALGISSDVVWPGFLAGEQKRAALAEAQVFALPSYSENFGIAVAEAMAAGLPVVVSDQVAIHADVSRARAGLVVRCDARELGDALVLLLTNATLRHAMGQEGRALARETYSLRAVSRTLIDVYNKIAL